MTIAWEHGPIRAGGESPCGGRVIKFGGSLLRRGGWPAALRALVGQVVAPTTIVVGGGGLVDGLRAIDAAHPLPAALSHRLAIDVMGLTARLVADATGFSLTAEPAAGAAVVVLDAPSWLAVGTRLADLPVGWHVTSDSIAAAVAAACDAALLLAKSEPPPAGDLECLARAGWVDDYFPLAAAPLGRIEWAAPATAAP
jgi:aspartokinase-like uncharacterized kinase